MSGAGTVCGAGHGVLRGHREVCAGTVCGAGRHVVNASLLPKRVEGHREEPPLPLELHDPPLRHWEFVHTTQSQTQSLTISRITKAIKPFKNRAPEVLERGLRVPPPCPSPVHGA